MRMHLVMLTLGCGFAALLIGCGGAQKEAGGVSPQSSLSSEFAGAPTWVRTKRCEAPAVANPDKFLCGVGQHTVESARRMGLGQSAAEAAGSAQIALILKQRVETLVKSYAAEWATGAGGEDKTEYEGKTVTGIRQSADLHLNGVRPADTWISPNNNLYVLMVASPDSVMAAVEGMKGLDTKVKASIDKHSDELFKEMDAGK